MSKRKRPATGPRAERRKQELFFRRSMQRIRRARTDSTSISKLVTARGSDVLALLLMERHLNRVDALRREATLPRSGWNVLLTIPEADRLLIRLGSGWPEHPDRGGRDSWPAHIMWGIDQAVQAIRLLRVGHVLGAASVARHQLERWTANMANHFSLSRNENESTSDYYDRVWSDRLMESDTLTPGEAWKELSEWLHGRSHTNRLFTLEFDTACLDRASSAAPAEIVGLRELIVHTIDLALRQVKGCIATLLREQGVDDVADTLNSYAEIKTTPEENDGLFVQLLQVDHIVAFGERGATIVGHGLGYRSFINHDETQKNLTLHNVTPFLAQGALVERRARAVELFRTVARTEARLHGKDLEFDPLAARLFRYIAISEAALLTASWTSDGYQRNALTAAAAHLRSAWLLWLEDTDVAMSCVRGVLEQTSRARAWRLKPTRAAKLEHSDVLPPPGRWVDTVGWNRISLLSSALGEFAHTQQPHGLEHARDLLESLQITDYEFPQHTARGEALEVVAYLLAYEVRERLDTEDSTLGAAFSDAVTLLNDEEHRRQLEDILNHGLEIKRVGSSSVSTAVPTDGVAAPAD